MPLIMGISDRVYCLELGGVIAEGDARRGAQRSRGHRQLPGHRRAGHRAERCGGRGAAGDRPGRPGGCVGGRGRQRLVRLTSCAAVVVGRGHTDGHVPTWGDPVPGRRGAVRCRGPRGVGAGRRDADPRAGRTALPGCRGRGGAERGPAPARPARGPSRLEADRRRGRLRRGARPGAAHRGAGPHPRGHGIVAVELRAGGHAGRCRPRVPRAPRSTTGGGGCARRPGRGASGVATRRLVRRRRPVRHRRMRVLGDRQQRHGAASISSARNRSRWPRAQSPGR